MQEFYDMPINFNVASLSIRAFFTTQLLLHALYVISSVIYSVLILTSENRIKITDRDYQNLLMVLEGLSVLSVYSFSSPLGL